MKVSGGISAEASSSWLSLISSFCTPLGSCLDGKPRRSKSTSLTATSISWPMGRSSDQDLLISEDDMKDPSQVVYDQPAYQPRPTTTAPEHHAYAASESEKPPRKSFASIHTTRTLKKRFRSDGSSRRPHISGPSDFRHVNSSTFNFPSSDAAAAPASSYPQARVRRPARPTSFRPLELSIYMSDNRMSPMLPHFEFPGADSLPLPEPALLVNRLGDDHQLIRQRSSPSLSFHLPRQAAHSGPHPKSSDGEAPSIPPKATSRARSYTSPDIELRKSRIASAMIEAEKLQRQIDDVTERQSLYVSSRPSTAHSMVHNLSAFEPMPSIPALPPAAPSFAERLNVELDRPKTAPILTPIDSPADIANRSQHSIDEQTILSTPTYVKQDDVSTPLPPPLPLVLRPPLRKKKSFSRVSTWLFPNGAHNRDLSLDSVTNLPRPVKGTEGFYQCVPAGSTAGRRSFESVGSVSTWETEEDEQRTVPTTWSPGSTPVAKQEASLERTATFGRHNASRTGRLSSGNVI